MLPRLALCLVTSVPSILVTQMPFHLYCCSATEGPRTRTATQDTQRQAAGQTRGRPAGDLLRGWKTQAFQKDWGRTDDVPTHARALPGPHPS